MTQNISKKLVYCIEKVISFHNDNIELPKICPSCKSDLIFEGVHIKCNNNNCFEKNIQQIIYWVKECKMEGIAETTIRTLFEKKFIINIIDLYLLNNKFSLIKDLEGFGEKKINNLKEQIEKSKSMSVIKFLSRLGINLVGEKAIKKLNINTLEDFWNFNDTTYVIGQNLISYRNNNEIFIKDLIKNLNIIEVNYNIINKVNKENKGNISMTGKGPLGRKELIKIIEEKGYNFIDSISKDINTLICDNIHSNSSKLIKAKKLNIVLKTYDEFFN